MPEQKIKPIIFYNEENLPRIGSRFNLPRINTGETSSRLYIHKHGLMGAYSEADGCERTTLFRARYHFLEQISTKFRNQYDFFIGILWGNENGFNWDKMIDLFAFKSPKEWPGNGNYHSFYICNESIDEDTTERTCGDGMILLGAEEQYRRTTQNLEDYATTPPIFRGLDLQDF